VGEVGSAEAGAAGYWVDSVDVAVAVVVAASGWVPRAAVQAVQVAEQAAVLAGSSAASQGPGHPRREAAEDSPDVDLPLAVADHSAVEQAPAAEGASPEAPRPDHDREAPVAAEDCSVVHAAARPVDGAALAEAAPVVVVAADQVAEPAVVEQHDGASAGSTRSALAAFANSPTG
jgi:hypothetical protein